MRSTRLQWIAGHGQQPLMRGAPWGGGVLPDQLDEPVVAAPCGVILRAVGRRRERGAGSGGVIAETASLSAVGRVPGDRDRVGHSH